MTIIRDKFNNSKAFLIRIKQNLKFRKQQLKLLSKISKIMKMNY